MSKQDQNEELRKTVDEIQTLDEMFSGHTPAESKESTGEDSEGDENASEDQNDKKDDTTENTTKSTEEPAEDSEDNKEEKDSGEEASDTEEVEEPDNDTPQEDSEDSSEDSQDNIFMRFNEQFGYEVDTADLDETFESHVEYTKRVADKIAEERLEKELGSLPDVKDFYEFRKNGGDPDQYFETKYPVRDYTRMEFEEENDQFIKEVLSDYLKEDGYDTRDINKKIKRFEEAGILKDEGKDAFNKLKKKQEQEKGEITQRQKERQEKEYEEIKKYWDNVKSTLDSKKSFAGSITIPEKEKDEIYQYMAIADEDGKSKFQKRLENLDAEELSTLAYVLKKGFDKIKKAPKAPDSYVEKLKKSTSSKKQSTKRSKGSGKSSTSRKTQAASGGSEMDADTIAETISNISLEEMYSKE